MSAYQPKVFKVLTVSCVDANSNKQSLDFIYYRKITNDYPRQGVGQEVNLNLANSGQIPADVLDNLILDCIRDIFGQPLSINYPCIDPNEEITFKTNHVTGAYTSTFTVNLFPSVLTTPGLFKSYDIMCVSHIPFTFLPITLHKDVPVSFETDQEAMDFFNLHIGK